MGHSAVVELLLFWGCYVDSIDPEGRTVLSVAAAQGSTDVVSQLLDRGKCPEVLGKLVLVLL
jgi:ankyrin repeat protein